MDCISRCPFINLFVNSVHSPDLSVFLTPESLANLFFWWILEVCRNKLYFWLQISVHDVILVQKSGTSKFVSRIIFQ